MTVKQLMGFAPLVHVAVLCPPEAAPTVLLNRMSTLGGMFVLMTHVPVQVGALSKANGQANVTLYPVFIFAIQQKSWEAYTGRPYEPQDMHQMSDVLNVSNPLVN